MYLSHIVDALRAAGDGATVELELSCGPFACGAVQVHQGTLWHAEVPGAQGLPAWLLLERLSAGIAHLLEGAVPRARSIEPGQQPPLTGVDAATMAAVRTGRAKGQLTLGRGGPSGKPSPAVTGRSLPPEPVPAPSVHSGEAYSLALSEEDLAAQDAYEVQFRRGTQAYLRRDLAAAQEAFEVCLRLRPGDRRSLYNLERLKKRP